MDIKKQQINCYVHVCSQKMLINKDLECVGSNSLVTLHHCKSLHVWVLRGDVKLIMPLRFRTPLTSINLLSLSYSIHSVPFTMIHS